MRNCGNEGELVCGALERDLFNEECDSGLVARNETCGCLIPNPLGGCLVPRPCQKCRNLTRHRPGTTNAFKSSWAAWALENQRKQLALDEPINWVMHIATHNAFNSVSDSHTTKSVGSGALGELIDAPNQFYSISDQLDLGVRALAIDAHWVGPPEHARLCHSLRPPAALEKGICRVQNPLASHPNPGMRYFANGVKEIRTWLTRNTQEIIILDVENYVGSCDNCEGGAAANDYYLGPIREYLGQWLLVRSGREPTAPFPSRAYLIDNDKRVILFARSPIDDDDLAPADVEFHESLFVSGVFPHWTVDNQVLDTCTDTTGSVGAGSGLLKRGQFTLVVEDRTLQAGFLDPPMGEIDVAEMRRLAQCNFTMIFTDFIGSAVPQGRDADVPDFGRHAAAVWSWKENDRGQNGDCAMLENVSGRWVSANCAQSLHYVCAPARSESGTATGSWDMREDDWKITESSGSWAGGPAACRAEFPAQNGVTYVFSVPVNGYQNERLLHAQQLLPTLQLKDLWLNYTDQSLNGRWLIPKLEDVNTPPLADAGPDQEVSCGNTVTLDGSTSVDPDGGTLIYNWIGPFGTLSGPVVTTRLDSGEHVITLQVVDPNDGEDTDTVTVNVVDTGKPRLSVSLSPRTLWPPNHRMVKVTAEVRAGDKCDGPDVSVELVSIVKSERWVHDGNDGHHDGHDDKGGRALHGGNHDDDGPDDDDDDDDGHGGGHGDHTGPDIEGAEFGTGDLEFFLRAERSSKHKERVYKVTYRAVDRAGNERKARTEVVVKREKDKKH